MSGRAVEELEERIRELEQHDRLRRRKRAVSVAVGASFALTVVVLATLWHPITDSHIHDEPWLSAIGLSLFGLFGVGALTSLWVPDGRQWRSAGAHILPLAGSVLAVPSVAVAVWFFYYKDVHVVQDRAVDVFERYTHRFPNLGDPVITDRSDTRADLCAELRPDQEYSHSFCLELDTDRPRGQEVIGGFKTEYIEHYEGLVAYEPYDCFGDAYACE